MKFNIFKRVIQIILYSVLIAAGFVFRDNILSMWTQLKSQYLPCRAPLTYSIGSFDPRFSVSRKDFLAAIEQAKQIWEKPVNMQLFAYTANGALQINLIYDSRQKATITLQKLGITFNNDQASYDALKTKYDALKAGYTQEKNTLDARVAALETSKNAYNAVIADWNARGGAPEDVIARLDQEKSALNSEIDAINQLQSDFNAKVDNLNALAVGLNQLATSLNLDVAHYKQVGSNTPSEFEEGNYVSGPSGQHIDIYQFNDKAKLVRVLAHELGHALGLEHVSNPKAIMYKFNSGMNEKLTADDLVELKTRCGIK